MVRECKRNGVGVFLWVLISAAGWLLMGTVVGLWGCVNSGVQEEESDGEIHFLDVGQGLAVLLEQGGRHALYDAGPDSVGILDTLFSRGIDTLEWVVISHNHRDHGGGMLELPSGPGRGAWRPKVYVRRFYVGPDTSGGFVRDSVLRIAKSFEIPVDTLYRGDLLSLGTLTFKVLWPARFLRVEGNGASLVLRGAAESRAGSEDPTSFLLTGDLDSAGEKMLLELSRDIHADLLQVGHHGSSESSSLRFLTSVSPRQAVISVGRDNPYGHPTEAVLRKLEYALNAPADSFGTISSLSRTDRDGSVSYRILPGVGILRE